jgi:hypothetical protein
MGLHCDITSIILIVECRENGKTCAPTLGGIFCGAPHQICVVLQRFKEVGNGGGNAPIDMGFIVVGLSSSASFDENSTLSKKTGPFFVYFEVRHACPLSTDCVLLLAADSGKLENS